MVEIGDIGDKLSINKLEYKITGNLERRTLRRLGSISRVSRNRAFIYTEFAKYCVR